MTSQDTTTSTATGTDSSDRHRRARRWGVPLAAALIAGSVIGGSAAFAANPQVDDPQLIHGCVSEGLLGLGKGAIRIIDDPDDCRANENPLSWNDQGIQGEQGPQGVHGPQGPQGPEGPPGSDAPQGVPVQLRLGGIFRADSNLLKDFDPIYHRSYSIPDGSTLRIEYVSCNAYTNGTPDTEKLQIWLEAGFEQEEDTDPHIRVVEMMTDNTMDWAGTEIVVSGPTSAYVGVTTPGHGTVGNSITLHARIDPYANNGHLECAVSGSLYE